MVLGISENHVEFCVRADLDWLDEGGAALVKQVEAAARAVESSSFVVLGYTENPDEHSERLVRLASEIRGRVTDVLMAASDRYWIVTPLGLTPPEGCAWDPAATALFAEAVYLGIQVAPNRAEVIAEVCPSGEPAEAESRNRPSSTLLSLDRGNAENSWRSCWLVENRCSPSRERSWRFWWVTPGWRGRWWPVSIVKVQPDYVSGSLTPDACAAMRRPPRYLRCCL